MSGLFDDLRRRLEEDGGPSGISAWELTTLPEAQRRLVRLILREIQMPYGDLCHAAAALPPSQRLEASEVDEALAALLAQSWLIRLGQGKRATYRVNLRRKSGSRLGTSIWERLERQIGASPGELG